MLIHSPCVVARICTSKIIKGEDAHRYWKDRKTCKQRERQTDETTRYPSKMSETNENVCDENDLTAEKKTRKQQLAQNDGELKRELQKTKEQKERDLGGGEVRHIE